MTSINELNDYLKRFGCVAERGVNQDEDKVIIRFNCYAAFKISDLRESGDPINLFCIPALYSLGEAAAEVQLKIDEYLTVK